MLQKSVKLRNEFIDFYDTLSVQERKSYKDVQEAVDL